MERVSISATRMNPVLDKNFIENPTVSPLFQFIQLNTPLVISTDGSKSERKSGGSWIITLECSTYVISGYNPSFDHIYFINSYRAEVYTSLTATLFFHLYSKYYLVPVNNIIHARCDNHAYVKKSTWLLEDNYHQHGLHKNTEAEELSLIL